MDKGVSILVYSWYSFCCSLFETRLKRNAGSAKGTPRAMSRSSIRYYVRLKRNAGSAKGTPRAMSRSSIRYYVFILCQNETYFQKTVESCTHSSCTLICSNSTSLYATLASNERVQRLRAILHCRWQTNHQYKKHAAIKEFGYRKNATIKAFFIRPHLTTFNLSVTWRILTAQARNQNVIIASKSTWFLS